MAEQEIEDVLDKSGLQIFKSIFDSNKLSLRNLFFNDKVLIRRMWPTIIGHLKANHCFSNRKAPNERLLFTYKQIVRDMSENY